MFEYHVRFIIIFFVVYMVGLYRCTITLHTSLFCYVVYFIVSNQRCINPFTALSLYHPKAVDTDLTNALALHCGKELAPANLQTQLVTTNSRARSWYVFRKTDFAIRIKINDIEKGEHSSPNIIISNHYKLWMFLVCNSIYNYGIRIDMLRNIIVVHIYVTIFVKVWIRKPKPKRY